MGESLKEKREREDDKKIESDTFGEHADDCGCGKVTFFQCKNYQLFAQATIFTSIGGSKYNIHKSNK